MAQTPQNNSLPAVLIAILLALLIWVGIPLLINSNEKLSTLYGSEKVQQKR